MGNLGVVCRGFVVETGYNIVQHLARGGETREMMGWVACYCQCYCLLHSGGRDLGGPCKQAARQRHQL
jgi:hypothetical protein